MWTEILTSLQIYSALADTGYPLHRQQVVNWLTPPNQLTDRLNTYLPAYLPTYVPTTHPI